MTQEELARELGVTQGTVSKWAKLDGDGPPLEQLPEIEKRCDRTVGYILRASGYVEEPQTTEEVIRADPFLDDVYVEVVVDSYRSAAERSSRSARARELTVDPAISKRAKR
jgi:transcriptional regulator with XRE-family HTH domain